MRLQYSSLMLANSADECRRTISEILTRSAAFNLEMRIGGLLCYNPATLAVTQIIEGPAGPVLELFDRICVDSRHRAVVLTLQEVVLDQRDVQFHARWGMMQTETREPPLLLDLAARLRASYACEGDTPPGCSSTSSSSTLSDLSSKARLRRHIEMAVDMSPALHQSIDRTPAEGDAMA